jgi:hypothetical protein
MTANQKIQLKTFRYIFTSSVVDLLSTFSKVHQYDDRHEFKDAWKKLLDDECSQQIINAEIERLNGIGFKDDILDKMFKSARYYYRKKIEKSNPAQKERKPYEGVTAEILAEIDNHIKTQISKNIKPINNVDKTLLISKISPAASFDNYCLEHKSTILRKFQQDFTAETSAQTTDNITQTIDIIKKTYKNRFHKIRITLQGTTCI